MQYVIKEQRQMTLFREFGEKTSEGIFLKLISNKNKESKSLKVLDKIDWDFKNFTTQYLSHKFHSYPARFIVLTFSIMPLKKGIIKISLFKMELLV